MASLEDWAIFYAETEGGVMFKASVLVFSQLLLPLHPMVEMPLPTSPTSPLSIGDRDL